MAAKKKARKAQKKTKATRTKAKKPRATKKSSTAKITKAELQAKLRDVDIPDEDLAKYFIVDQESGDGFAPQVIVNESLIEDDRLEGAGLLNIANSVARWRRNLSLIHI